MRDQPINCIKHFKENNVRIGEMIASSTSQPIHKRNKTKKIKEHD